MRLEIWSGGLIRTSSGVLNSCQVAIQGKPGAMQGLDQGDQVNMSSRFEPLARWPIFEIAECKLVVVKDLITNKVMM